MLCGVKRNLHVNIRYSLLNGVYKIEHYTTTGEIFGT